MGAVALVAMLAGGPLGMCLALAYGAVTILKIAKVDAQFAAKGELPPSAKLVDKWLDGRKAAGKAPKSAKPAKYGMWRYAWQRWQAMWEDLGQKHREVRDQYKTAVADAKAKGLQPPPKPKFAETLSGWKWHIDQLTAPATAPPAGDGSQPPPDAPATGGSKPGPAVSEPAGGPASGKDAKAAQPAPPPIPAKPGGRGILPSPVNGPGRGIVAPSRNEAAWWECPFCHRKEGLYVTGAESQAAYVAHAKQHHPAAEHIHQLPGKNVWAWACPTCGHHASGDAPDVYAVAAQHRCRQATAPSGQDAPTVNHPHPWTCRNCGATSYSNQPPPEGMDIRCNNCQHTSTEGDPMTQTVPQTSGEVTGIPSAINYLRTLAQIHATVGGNESLIARMADMKIGPADVAKVQAAMQASLNTAEQFAGAADTIALHNQGVREAYGSAPDAADKQHQMAE